jgi:hypothetical protein
MVQVRRVTSRLTPAARPTRVAGVVAPGSTIGPSAAPGSTNRRADTIVAVTAEASSAMGSMEPRWSLVPGA